MKLYSEVRGKIIILLIIVFQLLLTYCSKTVYPDSSFQNTGSQTENKKLKEFLDGGAGKILNTRSTSPDEIVKTARQYLGVPHCMGGTTMKCIDCSGLLYAVFARYGIHLPHNSEEQARYGKIINAMDDLKKGDLVFFVRSYKTDYFITHAGIYLGNKEFIHTSSKVGVTITSLADPWWNEKFIFGTRVFE